MILRTLIAAACLAVLAFVGHYFWREYQHQAAEQRLIAAQALAAEREKAARQARQAECDRTIAAINEAAQGRFESGKSLPQLKKDGEACVRDLQRILQLEAQDVLKKVTRP